MFDSISNLENSHSTDIFNSTVNLEEIHYTEGRSLGYKDGIKSGKEEARQTGLKHGFQIGEELGFYKGCIDIWISAIRIDPTHFSQRTQKRIMTMDGLVKKFPITEPELDEGQQDVMDCLRTEFRAVCMNLKIKMEYNGYPKSMSANVNDVEF